MYCIIYLVIHNTIIVLARSCSLYKVKVNYLLCIRWTDRQMGRQKLLLIIQGEGE